MSSWSILLLLALVGVVFGTSQGSPTLRGTILSISPSNSSVSGGVEVRIEGNGLGSGTDITKVTLSGVDATILGQTADTVTVRTGPTSFTCKGDAVVVSTSLGETRSAQGFQYVNDPIQACAYPTLPSAEWIAIEMKFRLASPVAGDVPAAIRQDLSRLFGTAGYRFRVTEVKDQIVTLQLLPIFGVTSENGEVEESALHMQSDANAHANALNSGFGAQARAGPPSALDLYMSLQDMIRAHDSRLLVGSATRHIDAKYRISSTYLRDCGKDVFLRVCPPTPPYTGSADKLISGVVIGLGIASVFGCIALSRWWQKREKKRHEEQEKLHGGNYIPLREVDVLGKEVANGSKSNIRGSLDSESKSALPQTAANDATVPSQPLIASGTTNSSSDDALP